MREGDKKRQKKVREGVKKKGEMRESKKLIRVKTASKCYRHRTGELR